MSEHFATDKDFQW